MRELCSYRGTHILVAEESDSLPKRGIVLDSDEDLGPLLSALLRGMLPSNAPYPMYLVLSQNNVGQSRPAPFTSAKRVKLPGMGIGTMVNLAQRSPARHCQTIFQLGHELVHVLAYPDISSSIRYQHPHQWFEEAIALVGSQRALLAVAEDPETVALLYESPHLGAFQSYAASERAKWPETPLLTSQLPGWFAEHSSVLRDYAAQHNKTARQLQGSIADWLLRHCDVPQLFAALRHLNESKLDPWSASFAEYLAAWHNACTRPQQREQVAIIRDAFIPPEVSLDEANARIARLERRLERRAQRRTIVPIDEGVSIDTPTSRPSTPTTAPGSSLRRKTRKKEK
jgi:hypothetical protein